jgi:type VI secretion system lysozyme-like protein
MAGDKIEVRMPLFDRLVDEDLSVRREVRPKRTLDRRGLMESVRRELEQLLNTRCPVPAHQLSERERSVIDYGIPDLSHLSAASHNDRILLAEYLRQAIATFEPRLMDVRVVIEEAQGNALGLSGRIEASLITETVPEPVSFATVLQLSEGSVEVHAQPE